MKNSDRFKELGIKIISLSVDDNYQKWEQASKKDGINWLNLSDLAGLKESEIAAEYKVFSVSTIFLIDPKGVIISQNPSLKTILSGNLLPPSDER